MHHSTVGAFPFVKYVKGVLFRSVRFGSEALLRTLVVLHVLGEGGTCVISIEITVNSLETAFDFNDLQVNRMTCKSTCN